MDKELNEKNLDTIIKEEAFKGNEEYKVLYQQKIEEEIDRYKNETDPKLKLEILKNILIGYKKDFAIFRECNKKLSHFLFRSRYNEFNEENYKDIKGFLANLNVFSGYCGCHTKIGVLVKQELANIVGVELFNKSYSSYFGNDHKFFNDEKTILNYPDIEEEEKITEAYIKVINKIFDEVGKNLENYENIEEGIDKSIDKLTQIAWVEEFKQDFINAINNAIDDSNIDIENPNEIEEFKNEFISDFYMGLENGTEVSPFGDKEINSLEEFEELVNKEGILVDAIEKIKKIKAFKGNEEYKILYQQKIQEEIDRYKNETDPKLKLEILKNSIIGYKKDFAIFRECNKKLSHFLFRSRYNEFNEENYKDIKGFLANLNVFSGYCGCHTKIGVLVKQELANIVGVELFNKSYSSYFGNDHKFFNDEKTILNYPDIEEEEKITEAYIKVINKIFDEVGKNLENYENIEEGIDKSIDKLTQIAWVEEFKQDFINAINNAIDDSNIDIENPNEIEEFKNEFISDFYMGLENGTEVSPFGDKEINSLEEFEELVNKEGILVDAINRLIEENKVENLLKRKKFYINKLNEGKLPKIDLENIKDIILEDLDSKIEKIEQSKIEQLKEETEIINDEKTTNRILGENVENKTLRQYSDKIENINTETETLDESKQSTDLEKA